MVHGFDLSGTVAVVIGGSSGIGRALAPGLAEAGADVVVTGRRQALVDEAGTDLEGMGRRTARLTVDIGDRASVVALGDSVTAALGPCDILINCAGRTRRSPTLDVDEAEWAPMKSLGSIPELAGVGVFLASPVASFVTGDILVVDGGVLASGVNQ